VCSFQTFENGRLQINTNGLYQSGAQVGVICDAPFAPAVQTTMCHPDRTWDPKPSCTDVTCTVPALTLGNYKLNQNEVTQDTFLAYHSVIIPHCTTGFSPQPNSSRICQDNGQWTGQPPICVTITCNSQPPGFLNGFYETGSQTKPFKYNDEIIPTCFAGFYLQQGETRNCTAVNSWSGSSPICSPITCGPPDNFSHGFYNASQTIYQFKSALLASCDVGYNLISNENPRVCEEDNTWTGNEPVCQTVECTSPSLCEHGALKLLSQSWLILIFKIKTNKNTEVFYRLSLSIEYYFEFH